MVAWRHILKAWAVGCALFKLIVGICAAGRIISTVLRLLPQIGRPAETREDDR